ncbi:MAG: sarcosine oxidase subunit gamma [Methylobacterium mesophilicum]|nr:sarcosine oxidase subunit gamma [Methylobacterium mesophilicum]
MAEIATAQRRTSLETRAFDAKGVSLTLVPPAFRISLRGPEASLSALEEALGLALPRLPKTSSEEGTRAALWIGPDEWLVIDTDTDPLPACRGVEALHSAVDISHRNVGLAVSGKYAAEAVNGGCPQDLSPEAFPVGACSRTVLGKIEIVLWKTAEDSFRVECWRSFSPYAFAFLTAAARDAAA